VSDRPAKVTFVISSLALGGAERQLAALIAQRPDSAQRLDLEVVTFLQTSSPATASAFAESGVRHTLIDRAALPFVPFFTRLVRHFRRTRPDVVHTVLDSSTGAWGRLAAWLTGVPVIVHSDRSLMTEGTRAHRLLRPFLDRITRHFFPNAEAIAERLVSTGVPRDRITVVANGVDLDRFRPSDEARRVARSAWGLGDSATVAGFLGRFVPVKRIDVLLDAVTSLPVTSRPDHIVFVGDGPLMPDIRRRTEADPWLHTACTFLGARDDVAEVLAGIDYLVLPSAMEGLPNAVLEAMAMAKPIVATRVSDVPLIVADVGFLAPPEDVAGFAAALAQMAELSATERRALGTRARARVEESYALRTISNRFWQAHLDLLPKNGRRASR
jgi:glycosyltransferase involved in cell wall biosynthesis